MNAFFFDAARHLTCAAAALLITFVLGASFVQSTSAAPAVFGTAVTSSAST